MHNLFAIFATSLEICKLFVKTLVNEEGNQPHRGVVPLFSDLEVIALSLTVESVGIDSENNLFAKLFSEYHDCSISKELETDIHSFCKSKKKDCNGVLSDV